MNVFYSLWMETEEQRYWIMNDGAYATKIGTKVISKEREPLPRTS